MDNIQLNTAGEVISCGGIELDEPMEVSEFVDMLRKVRQAVDTYFDMVMKADKGLKKFLQGDSAAAKIAYTFKDMLIEEFANKHGISIHSFKPKTEETDVISEIGEETEGARALPVTSQDGPAETKSAIDWHIEHRNLISSKDVEHDILTQSIVIMCEDFLERKTGAGMRRPENRKGIICTTLMLWEYIEELFEGVNDALDPRLEDELPAILIENGWRVIGKARWGESLLMLPFGLGVPGCYWARTEDDDHPLWGL